MYSRASDEVFMGRAIALANQGGRMVHPNPYVGSLVVVGGRILGEGWHGRYGGSHAEVLALKEAQDKGYSGTDGTLYTTLSPCTHTGHTPPCVDAILQSGIRRVVVATQDPNPIAQGGIKALRTKGVKVKEGVLSKEARWLNRRFFTFVKRRRPYVILKWAESNQGFLCLSSAQRTPQMNHRHTQYLTHKWRSEEDAILVGRKTAAIDNPQLNVRSGTGPNPTRIVLDPHMRLPHTLNLFNDETPTHAFAYEKVLLKAKSKLPQYSGLPKENFLKALLHFLYERNILSLIVEGGPTTLQAWVKENLWDEARILRCNYDLSGGQRGPNLAQAKWKAAYHLTQDPLHVYVNS